MGKSVGRSTSVFLMGMVLGKDSAIVYEQLRDEGGVLGRSLFPAVLGSDQSSDG